MRVLVVNAGSSSLKLRVLDDHDDVVDRADPPPPEGPDDTSAVEAAVSGFGPIDAVGHRIVHGGTFYTGPVRLDASVVARLRSLTDLAPLHQPKSLTALDAVAQVLPDVPAVASFDTAFHAGLPAAASTYALPEEWRRRWELRRYGFHGLSHAYASRRACELIGVDLARTRVVTCHLGAGASLAAVAGGRSVDTTMGFTPLEGLVMATRSGTVDPGLVLWLQDHAGLAAADVASALEHRSGMLALAGTADMREILSAAASGSAAARLALDVYLHRLRAGVASMAAAMDGLDVLVFTGGVGENAPAVRSGAVDGLSFLRAHVDPGLNADGPEDREISAGGSAVRVVVVGAREDKQIAAEVRAILS